ncbi:MAG: hypothetical protein MI784_07355 [Cytophagales bacterium]|nr:hypothetical protein [Cytophagales bacterium]
MKKLGFFLSLVLFNISAFAQENTKLHLKCSKELKSPSAQALYDIVPCKGGCFYSLKYNTYNGQKAKLYHYEKDFSISSIRNLPLKIGKKKLQFESFFCTDHNPYYVCSYMDKERKKRDFYVFSANDQKKIPFQFTVLSESSIYHQIDYRYSPDKSKFMLVVSLLDGNLKTFVFNREMGMLRKETVRVKGYNHVYEQISLDNQGNSYFLVTRDNLANKEYSLVTSTGGKLQEIGTPGCLSGKSLLNMQLTNSPYTGELVCAGYFSDPAEDNKKGIYLFTVKDQKVQCAQSHFLDESELREGFEKPIVWGKLELGEIIPKKDGSFLLVAEEYFEESHYVGDFKGTLNMEDSFFGTGDMLVASLGRSGNILWSKRIQKAQYSVNDNAFYNSYSTAVFGRNLYIFYNEPAKRDAYKMDKAPLVYLVLDEKGNTLDKQKVIDAKDFGVLAQPQTAKQNDRGEIILFGQKNNKERFFKFSPAVN